MVLDTSRLREILQNTTINLRREEDTTPKLLAQTDDSLVSLHKAYGWLPSRTEIEQQLGAREGLEEVDCFYIKVLVDRAAAEEYRDEITQLLTKYPQPDRLKAGLSYLEMGDHLHDFRLALPLFALGKILDLWSISLPEGEGRVQEALASAGAIRISGWQPRG